MKREALYNLVWTVPMAKLAREFQLSDRGMAKLCQRERIPVPPRGYWAKLAAGHAVRQTPLPDRIAGQSEWVMVAPRASAYGAEGRTWLESRTRQLPDDDAALSLDPAPPSHDRDLHVLAWRTHRTVGSVRVRKRELKASLHPELERLLREAREDWELRPPYLSAGTQRRFADPGARRRLALVNALFLALGKAGARPEVADKEGRSIVVTVGRMPVRCQLASTWMRRTRGAERQERLDFHVRAGTSSCADRSVWKERCGLSHASEISSPGSWLPPNSSIETVSGGTTRQRWRPERKREGSRSVNATSAGSMPVPNSSLRPKTYARRMTSGASSRRSGANASLTTSPLLRGTAGPSLRPTPSIPCGAEGCRSTFRTES